MNEVRDASTVVLVRDGSDGIETFLITRVSQMAFAPGMTVFPGGGVDPGDGVADAELAGGSADQLAKQLSCEPAMAHALVCAALRELFEETGVLLAEGLDGSAPNVAGLQRYRRKLEAHEMSVSEFARDAGLRLRGDLLRPVDHWITPEGVPIRYNTRFFVAALPTGQHADGLTREAASTGWFTASQAMAEERAGTIRMLPPTLAQLREISSATTVSELLSKKRAVRPHQPSIAADGTLRMD